MPATWIGRNQTLLEFMFSVDALPYESPSSLYYIQRQEYKTGWVFPSTLLQALDLLK